MTGEALIWCESGKGRVVEEWAWAMKNLGSKTMWEKELKIRRSFRQVRGNAPANFYDCHTSCEGGHVLRNKAFERGTFWPETVGGTAANVRFTPRLLVGCNLSFLKYLKGRIFWIVHFYFNDTVNGVWWIILRLTASTSFIPQYSRKTDYICLIYTAWLAKFSVSRKIFSKE